MKKVNKSEKQWKKELSEEQYHVLRQKGTERPFTGKHIMEKRPGMYSCAACGAKLFSSKSKFHSGSGWPSFWDNLDKKSVKLSKDTSYSMMRTEVRCARCDGHLGHVFDISPKDNSEKMYYCINSCALEFNPK